MLRWTPLRLLIVVVLSLIMAGGKTTRVSAGENYALLVSVAEYDPKELKPLKHSRADIREFQKVLLASGFRSANVVMLHDDKSAISDLRYIATADNIREQLSILLKSPEKGDTLIVAFAGHGVQFKGDKDSYYCPQNTRLANRDTLVSFADVLKAMEACEATHKLLLVDACRNDPQTSIARSRSEVNLESVTRPQEAVVPKSLMAFYSCAPGQQSFEDPDLGHGIFFHHVLKGWNGAADQNRDGKLEFEELKKYVRTETDQFARTKLNVSQTPRASGDDGAGWVLRSSVPADAVVFRGHSYKFFPQQHSWKDAKARCEAIGGRLIVVNSAEENQFAADLITAGNFQDCWIGATDEAKEGDWRTIDGQPLPYTNWFDRQPNNGGGREHFGLMSGRTIGASVLNWRWSDQANDAANIHQPGYLCEWDTAVVPSTAKIFGRHSYQFFPGPISWKAARDRCKAAGGRLVTIESTEENQFVAKLIESAGEFDSWLGITDEAKEGAWLTTDGKAQQFFHWGSNQPNNKGDGEHFALISGRVLGGIPFGWKWADQPNVAADIHKPGYVCEWEKLPGTPIE